MIKFLFLFHNGITLIGTVISTNLTSHGFFMSIMDGFIQLVMVPTTTGFISITKSNGCGRVSLPIHGIMILLNPDGSKTFLVMGSMGGSRFTLMQQKKNGEMEFKVSEKFYEKS